MNTRTACLFAIVVAGLPIAAFGQSADSKYCSALSEKYTTYAQANEGKSHNAPPVAVATAMSKCSSDPGPAIPVLENALNSAKITLPPRS